MEKLIINGKKKLTGKIQVQGSKNAVLPMLAASILTEEKVVILRCPRIKDVDNMLRILSGLGCTYWWEGDTLTIDSANIHCCEIAHDLAKELRSSIFMLGSIVSRLRKAQVAYPGGCDIGLRPIDLHIKGLQALNVSIEENGGILRCSASDIRGATVHLDCPSVGATENVMLAAVLAEGTTLIRNAAKEPEIVDLQNFINAMGGKISGAGSSNIEVVGVKKLHGVTFCPIPDRIVAGTYLIACAVTGGEMELTCCWEHVYSLVTKLRESACKIECYDDKIYIKAPQRLSSVHIIETMPYPGFPTDLQAQVLAMTTVADGTSVVVENIFETRFKHVAELVKMGAKITVRDRMAIVRGVPRLHAAEVWAHDLRGGAALIIAALSAEGQSTVCDIGYVDRGYENIEGVLSGVGADIKRI